MSELVPGMQAATLKYEQSLKAMRLHKPNRPSFLQPCTLVATATKTPLNRKHSYYGEVYDRTEWIREPIKSVTMTYVGSRAVKNGAWESSGHTEDGDSESYFQPTEILEVWLFIPNERQNIVRAFPVDVTIIEQEQDNDD